MNIFTMIAIPTCFLGLLSILLSIRLKKWGFYYLGYWLGVISFLSARAGMM